MKPDVDFVLRTIASKLVTDVAPAVADAYTRSNLEVAAGLLIAAAEDYDRAAQVRVEDNRAIRALFADAALRLPDGALRERLGAAARSEDESLRIADLGRANDSLRALLIELHAYVESLMDDWAVEICRAIWRELEAGAARRAIGFYPL